MSENANPLVTGDQVRKCVERLAHVPLGMNLIEWSGIANTLLAAADALDRTAIAKGGAQ